MDSPFQFNTSQQLFHICYTLFSLGILSLVARKITENVLRNGLISEKLNVFWVDTDAFILTAAVVYVVACIYTRGVEIQHENDLTV